MLAEIYLLHLQTMLRETDAERVAANRARFVPIATAQVRTRRPR